MLSIIVGLILIGGGLLWAVLVVFAAGMASRPVDEWHEVWKPALWGGFPIALGASLIIWR